MRQPEVVVVTGASAGVGRAVVRRFAADGARIALLARGREGLEAARREVEAAGGQALVIPADVADAAQVEAAAAAVEERFGPMDIWINNAMVSVFSPVHQMEPSEYQRVTEVTYLGSVYGALAALKRMRPRDAGCIVQVGSALAYRGIPLQSAYCAAKHAVQGFLDSLTCELIHDGSAVHVTHVHLPAVNTPQFGWVKSRLPNKAQPVPPIFTPELIAETIHWAAHQRRREVWVGMPVVKAILGNRVAPGLLDQYLASVGYEGQQTDEPEDPGRPHNLWEPVPGDHGAAGAFSHRSSGWSAQIWATMHRGPIVVGALLGAAAAAIGATAVRRPRLTDADLQAGRPVPGPGPKEREELRTLIG
jgi:NAD(P)-dependent dehydrogenase (short-subunit alcohol dehydrogenase family)